MCINEIAAKPQLLRISFGFELRFALVEDANNLPGTLRQPLRAPDAATSYPGINSVTIACCRGA
jgi:hypothetical protein